MTWPTAPVVIAAVLGLIGLLMILASQHGYGTTSTDPHDPPDGEQP